MANKREKEIEKLEKKVKKYEILIQKLVTENERKDEKIKVLEDALKAQNEVTSKEVERSMEEVVTKYLREIGIPIHNKGYKYLRTAIMLILKDSSLMELITRRLYPMIGKQYGTNGKSVERAIRDAIEVAWRQGNSQIIDELFSNTVSAVTGRPTNLQFITTIADTIRLEQK